jgi:hypothetical protein
MLIKGLDAGVSEHQLADAGILLCELGAYQAPQVMWFDIQRTSGEAQVIEEILGVLLARRWADGPCENGIA